MTHDRSKTEWTIGRLGQVGNVCFAQGPVLFQNEWILYYGMSDSQIGCATATAR